MALRAHYIVAAARALEARNAKRTPSNTDENLSSALCFMVSHQEATAPSRGWKEILGKRVGPTAAQCAPYSILYI